MAWLACEPHVTKFALLDAVARMERGLIDADLGRNRLKQRVALPVRGNRFANVVFFLFGFEKNDRSNISAKELMLYRRLREHFHVSQSVRICRLDRLKNRGLSLISPCRLWCLSLRVWFLTIQ
ncbi:type II toxin-antitoxin system RelE/ParE family toxin [Rhodoferax sp.]|uniref:type II toxin-antitoxin system RelE/ParE family toxin n=1 Tax=Rhodoferax sp. TaxID=50421 RepID=UPI0025CE7BBE|nr:type II toxin-antitoxin system RelE/ParE family toxin [Rhodoferax sp.]